MLDQAPQQFERGTAGADDHGGPELGDGDAVGREFGPDLLAARKVGRQSARRITQATEVDDVPDTCLASASGEGAGGTKVPQLESPFAAGHGVRQVVGGVDVLERRRQRRWIEQVDSDDLGIGKARGEPAWVAAGQSQSVAAFGEQCDQPPTDVAAGPDDQDAHRCLSPAP